MASFLFELGCEEIPASMVDAAVADLEQALRAQLAAQQLNFASLESFATPRRLALLLKGLDSQQPDRSEELLGPAASVAFDAAGRPTRAALGFAQKAGVSIEQIQTRSTPKGQYLGFTRSIPGRPAADVLAELLPRIVTAIRFPKTMYWDDPQIRFIRPIRWFVALLDDAIVPFRFGSVQSGRISRGHAALSKGPVVIDHADRYAERLRAHYVEALVQERRKRICEGLAEAAGRAGGRLLEDEDLIATVIHLVEWPAILKGRFEEHFLQLPQEVLVTVMKHHQKYFSAVDSAGKLLPCFLAVLNTEGDHHGSIGRGHERVLKARLEDAAFFWRQDRKRRLEDRVGDLEKIVFQVKLGTYAEKSARVARLVEALAEQTGQKDLQQELLRAARFCKVDLSTEMVKELTELQGIMGGVYARADGEPETVWKAIYEQYLPLSLEGPLPDSIGGALLSLADKIDSVVGCFCVGIQPKGSSDPFALRRQAQGIVRIALERQLDFSLDAVLGLAADAIGSRATLPKDQALKAVREFIEGRLRFVLKERDLRYDIINAAVGIGFDSLCQTEQRAAALARIRPEPDFQALAVSFKRIRNILAGAELQVTPLRPELFSEEAEQKLWSRLEALRPTVEEDLSRRDYYQALKRLAALRADVDYFFDKVLVMTQDLSVRQNRLKLLETLSNAFLAVGDISEIVVES